MSALHSKSEGFSFKKLYKKVANIKGSKSVTVHFFSMRLASNTEDPEFTEDYEGYVPFIMYDIVEYLTKDGI